MIRILSFLPQLSPPAPLGSSSKGGNQAGPVRREKMSAPTMEERKACWGARDEFWQCLDRHGEDGSKCAELRRGFEGRCPQQWVKYFDKRRDFLKYKKKLETEGYGPPEAAGKS
ncbi:cytochrome c oxidase assembly factor 6-like protein [Patagioenas fasciata monilis]|uniref:Cytochrome c oxidase assembly factor 6-like protein n=2 Tax=Patagioenas fasciata TaxID=372321 RepID=A0A1V4JKM6_PATFA|nr:cytochrome c oxidase assembly factor 6-like protein [Patagioenas fasciata monilis]